MCFRKYLVALAGAVVLLMMAGTSEMASKEKLVIFGTELPELVQSARDKIAEGFEAENPGIEVVWRLEGEWKDSLQRMMTARLAGEQMDVIVAAANPTNSVYVREKLLMDLTEVIGDIRKRVDPAALEAFTIGGRIWAIPHSCMSTSAWYYNKAIFKKYGLEEPKTYSDMVAIARKLNQAGVIPAVHQGKNPWMWPMWYFETFAQTSGNKSVELTIQNLMGKRKFTSPEDVQALEAIANFVKDGILGKGVLDTDWEGMRSAFVTGKAAMYYGGSWELPWLLANAKGMDIGIFEFPLIKQGVISQHGGGPDQGLAISSSISPKRFNLALKFIEYCTRDNPANMWLAPMEPIATTHVNGPKSSNPIAREMATQFVPHTIRFLDWIWPLEVSQAFQQAIQSVVAGVRTPQEAMQVVQKAYDDLVAKGYRFDYWNTWSESDWALVTPPTKR
ncbi:MAG: extracellular solute-binding protein [Bacillota bacterium]